MDAATKAQVIAMLIFAFGAIVAYVGTATHGHAKHRANLAQRVTRILRFRYSATYATARRYGW